MFLFFLIRGNWFRGYKYPLIYYPLCLFLDLIIIGAIVIEVAMIVNGVL